MHTHINTYINTCIHTYMQTHICVVHHGQPLTLAHDEASVAPAALVRYLPALQAVHAVELEAENHPLAHCILKRHNHTRHSLYRDNTLHLALPQTGQLLANMPLTEQQRHSPLTLVHDAASVPPDASVRYLPALHAVHTDAPLAENHPLAHCIHTTHTHTLSLSIHASTLGTCTDPQEQSAYVYIYTFQDICICLHISWAPTHARA